MKEDHGCGAALAPGWVAGAVRAGGSLSSLPLRSSSDMRPCSADAGDVSDLTRRLSPDVGREGGVEGGMDMAGGAQEESMVWKERCEVESRLLAMENGSSETHDGSI